jgi:hypothetical protein
VTITHVFAGIPTADLDDLDRWIAELEQRGIAVGTVEQMGSGARKALVADPDGNELGFAQTG